MQLPALQVEDLHISESNWTRLRKRTLAAQLCTTTTLLASLCCVAIQYTLFELEAL